MNYVGVSCSTGKIFDTVFQTQPDSFGRRPVADRRH